MDFRTLQSLALRVGASVNPDEVLKRIVDGLAAQEAVALARVWLSSPAEGGEQNCLRLVASAGNPLATGEDWTCLDGHFARVPFGSGLKIGQIGTTGHPILINNDLQQSHWVQRPDWAQREGIVSFAGQPLIHRGEILGVLAVFSRASMTPEEGSWLRIFADHAALAIVNARAFEEVNQLRRQLELERDYLREEVKEALTFGPIIGQSLALQEVLQQCRLVAPTDATVLILGESGTGKELIATSIHEWSPRRERPLVRVNAGSIPSELFESEFFGHARGSFTGAVHDRIGRFQLADGGTLFLDEIGEIPLAHQVKLLRVLQDGEFQRVGEEKTRKVNVRIIAATHRDLGTEVTAGRFREDLFYRLSVFPLKLPPLRQRRDDVPALARHFVSILRARLNRPAVRLTNDDTDLLQRYDWPGNVRELQNVIERAVILASGPRLRLDLALAAAITMPAPANDSTDTGPTLEINRILHSDELKRLERESIVAALQRANRRVSGNGGAAELLGMNPNTLVSRMRALGIKRKE